MPTGQRRPRRKGLEHVAGAPGQMTLQQWAQPSAVAVKRKAETIAESAADTGTDTAKTEGVSPNREGVPSLRERLAERHGPTVTMPSLEGVTSDANAGSPAKPEYKALGGLSLRWRLLMTPNLPHKEQQTHVATMPRVSTPCRSMRDQEHSTPSPPAKEHSTPSPSAKEAIHKTPAPHHSERGSSSSPQRDEQAADKVVAHTQAEQEAAESTAAAQAAAQKASVQAAEAASRASAETAAAERAATEHGAAEAEQEATGHAVAEQAVAQKASFQAAEAASRAGAEMAGAKVAAREHTAAARKADQSVGKEDASDVLLITRGGTAFASHLQSGKEIPLGLANWGWRLSNDATGRFVMTVLPHAPQIKLYCHELFAFVAASGYLSGGTDEGGPDEAPDEMLEIEAALEEELGLSNR